MTNKQTAPRGWSNLRLWPTTRLGRWSIGLVGLFFTAFVVMLLVVASGQEGGETILDNWLISGPALISLGGAVGAFITGVIAVTQRGERALAVMIGIAIGALVMVFVLGEFIGPH